MDDRTFDEKSAKAWIENIERPEANVREGDLYPMLRAWLAAISAKDILDIGAGQGVCSEHVVPKGARYTGLEPSPVLLRRAQELYERADRAFISGSVYQMPFANESFDAVFSVSLWHLLRDLEKAANEVARVLKPNGHFFIVTANPGAYAAWADFFSEDDFQQHTLEAITHSLVQAGLSVTKQEAYRPSEKAGGQGIHLALQGRKSI